MIRAALLALSAFTLSGCLDWQSTYDGSARSECGALTSPDERRACNDAVERNAREKRAEQRS